ncbi:MAG TPA: Fe-S-containing hydro-lyase [Clostridiales bacterium]|jgi:fumarate hydratase subunit beta|nr:Fe-S-containing hydro-lyase [Clostridiales bacterium]HCS11888.1 Fe-S-containing hydro-lyase [Clostridiales bacterium]
MNKIINTPLTDEVINDLKAGDRVLLNGIIYTGRDAAHKRLVELIENGEELPMDIKNQTIYYVGPCPAKPGQVIGSAGPTTSGRMDAYAPLLMEHGLKGMIGKGIRAQQVVDSMIKNNAVYFAAIGGAGALLAEAIKEAEVIAFPDLGAEAIYKLRIENFPVTVVIDNRGNDLYKLGKEKYKKV